MAKSGSIIGLRAGEIVQFRPRGQSMRGKVPSGALCTVAPIGDPVRLEVGEIVLCKVRGVQYLHLVKAIRDGQYLIGNNRGGVNGWITVDSIHGRLIAVEA